MVPCPVRLLLTGGRGRDTGPRSVCTAMLAQLLLVLVGLPFGWLRSPPSFPGLPTVKELAYSAGYTSTDVEVITEDKHSLWMHRIGNSTGPPVIMQHGLLVAAESWIVRGRGKDLAFMLLEAGFDVWLTNMRGTVYNQYNLKYSRKDPRFWDFSFHEAGYYDLPAFIDRVLKIRGEKKLFYVGHSLGTTIFLVMTSLRPEYNSKIQGAVLLSPVSFPPTLDEFGANPFLRFSIHNADSIYAGFVNGKVYELLPRTSSNIRTIKQICSGFSASQDLCLDAIGLYAGEHRINIDKKNIGYYMSFSPAGTSVKNLYHLAQIYRSGKFALFDYGQKGNSAKYNSTIAPDYPLDNVTAPVALIWSYNDPIISQNSVQKLAARLPNLLQMTAVPDPKFTHLDMIWGENAKYVLYPSIIATFQTLL